MVMKKKWWSTWLRPRSMRAKMATSLFLVGGGRDGVGVVVMSEAGAGGVRGDVAELGGDKVEVACVEVDLGFEVLNAKAEVAELVGLCQYIACLGEKVFCSLKERKGNGTTHFVHSRRPRRKALKSPNLFFSPPNELATSISAILTAFAGVCPYINYKGKPSGSCKLKK